MRTTQRTERAARPGGRSGGRALAEFFAVGLVTVAVVGVGGVVASRRAGEDEAVNDVRQLTQAMASTLVAPAAGDDLLAGDPASLAALDVAFARSLSESPLTRVKVWTPNGRIVYSDEHRLVGSVYELDAEHLEALATGGVVAELSALDGPENRFEQDRGRLLEVYTPVTGPDGDRLLFEAYFEAAGVAQAGARIWQTFVPIVLGCLLLTEAAHLGLAWRLTRRLRASQADRERLLERSIGASDAERSRIAGNLHDGVVQDLVGLSFELSAAAGQLESATDPEVAQGLRSAAAGARRCVQALRTLMVDIYPPNLEQRGLGPALADLLEPLAASGIETDLQMNGEPDLTPDGRKVVYRTVQEALRNATKHAAPKAVTISVSGTSGHVITEISDDGTGFDVTRALVGVPGHLGLTLLRDLAASIDADVAIASRPGTGTTVRMRVPA